MTRKYTWVVVSNFTLFVCDLILFLLIGIIQLILSFLFNQDIWYILRYDLFLLTDLVTPSANAWQYNVWV